MAEHSDRTEFAGELDMVCRFLERTQKGPLRMGGREVPVFFWGAEIWMESGGKRGGRGRLDLLGTDLDGQVWLVEAKESVNPELRPSLWQAQLIPYHSALSRELPDDIALRAQRLLVGNGRFPKPPFISDGCASLLEAFKQWLGAIRPEESDAANAELAQDLFNQTFLRIRKGAVMLGILADTFDESIWESRPSGEQGAAYLVLPKADGEVHVAIDGHPAMPAARQCFTDNTWQWLRRKKFAKGNFTPTTLRDVLANEVLDRYDALLEGFEKLGWDGNFSNKTKNTSFTLYLSTRWGGRIGFDLGLPDKDSGSTPKENKMRGSAGFKCDVEMKDFKNNPDLHEQGLSLARKFIAAGWLPRGEGEPLAQRALTEAEKNTWHSWRLLYRPSKQARDFIGRPEELPNIKRLIETLAEGTGIG